MTPDITIKSAASINHLWNLLREDSLHRITDGFIDASGNENKTLSIDGTQYTLTIYLPVCSCVLEAYTFIQNLIEDKEDFKYAIKETVKENGIAHSEILVYVADPSKWNRFSIVEATVPAKKAEKAANEKALKMMNELSMSASGFARQRHAYVDKQAEYLKDNPNVSAQDIMLSPEEVAASIAWDCCDPSSLDTDFFISKAQVIRRNGKRLARYQNIPLSLADCYATAAKIIGIEVAFARKAFGPSGLEVPDGCLAYVEIPEDDRSWYYNQFMLADVARSHPAYLKQSGGSILKAY